MSLATSNHPISEEAYIRILNTVFNSLREVGFKATTMDSIASRLSMSKRTLYEIFESKEEMLHEALHHYHHVMEAKMFRIFSESENVMQALIRIIHLQLNILSKTNPIFFTEMDTIGKRIKNQYEDHKERNIEIQIMSIIRTGIRQDVFREDENYKITLKFLNIQFEALKRAEKQFPPNVTLSDIYVVMSINFLRSIATPKGTKILEDYIETYKDELKTTNFSN